jgi:hypothetical protein
MDACRASWRRFTFERRLEFVVGQALAMPGLLPFSQDFPMATPAGRIDIGSHGGGVTSGTGMRQIRPLRHDRTDETCVPEEECSQEIPKRNHSAEPTVRLIATVRASHLSTKGSGK